MHATPRDGRRPGTCVWSHPNGRNLTRTQRCSILTALSNYRRSCRMPPISSWPRSHVTLPATMRVKAKMGKQSVRVKAGSHKHAQMLRCFLRTSKQLLVFLRLSLFRFFLDCETVRELMFAAECLSCLGAWLQASWGCRDRPEMKKYRWALWLCLDAHLQCREISLRSWRGEMVI